MRVSINALAAVLGGVQTLHTSAFDEALGVPTEAAATLALRTQQVILEETGIPNVVDPLGGSYAIEALTAEIESRVRTELAKMGEITRDEWVVLGTFALALVLWLTGSFTHIEATVVALLGLGLMIVGCCITIVRRLNRIAHALR